MAAGTKDITDWGPEVLKYVKNVDKDADVNLLDDEIKETLRDFCEHTGLWTKELPRIDVVADQRDYVLTVPTDEGTNEIVLIERILYKEEGQDDEQFRKLFPVVEWERDRKWTEYGNWTFRTGEPTGYFMNYQKTLSLNPIPINDSDEGLLVRLQLKPADDADEVPFFIWEDYKKAIAWGSAGRIMSMTNKRWSNPALGDAYWAKYLDRRGNAYEKKQTGFTSEKSRVEIPWFGGSRDDGWVF